MTARRRFTPTTGAEIKHMAIDPGLPDITYMGIRLEFDQAAERPRPIPLDFLPTYDCAGPPPGRIRCKKLGCNWPACQHTIARKMLRSTSEAAHAAAQYGWLVTTPETR